MSQQDLKLNLTKSNPQMCLFINIFYNNIKNNINPSSIIQILWLDFEWVSYCQIAPDTLNVSFNILKKSDSVYFSSTFNNQTNLFGSWPRKQNQDLISDFVVQKSEGEKGDKALLTKLLFI